jgi:hypothetical protein
LDSRLAVVFNGVDCEWVQALRPIGLRLRWDRIVMAIGSDWVWSDPIRSDRTRLAAEPGAHRGYQPGK